MKSASGLAVAALSLLSSVAGSSHKVPGLPKGTSNVTAPTYGRVRSQSFVQAKNNKITLDGQPFSIRSVNAPNLLPSTSEFETEDTLKTFAAFGVPVTRTYILATVQNDFFGGNVWESISLITGWDKNASDWVYNEKYFQTMDKVLDAASRYGVRLIIPLVNQDYGDESTDWFGSFNDLIRIRYNISSYATAQQIDWFTDEEIRLSFFKLITKALTRKNTVNGKIWGQDPTIMAWETGNEMNHGEVNASDIRVFDRPAPANWTIDVAKHIKSLAPNTLVQDGSYSRVYDVNRFWPKASLESEYVDLFSWHAYGDGDAAYWKNASAHVASYGKTFIVGEHGFYKNTTSWQTAFAELDAAKVPAALVWSMRPHADSSGFLTHSEGSGVYSYHFPGWHTSAAPDMQSNEYAVSHLIYQNSFKAIGKPVPPHPIPDVPVLKDATNKTFGNGVTWRGATWAWHYELWAASLDAPFFQVVGSHLKDNVDEGALFVPVTPSDAGFNITFSPPTHQNPTDVDWHDPKWALENVHSHKRRSHKALHERLSSRQKAIEEAKAKNSTSSASSSSNSSSSSSNDTLTVGYGSWYIIRGLSAEGVPGPFSSPIFVKSNQTST